MTKDEALHLALEELENCADLLKVFGAPIDSCVGATMLQAEAAITAIKQALAAPVQDLPFGVGGGLVAIKTLLSRDPCVHANTAIEMIDAILKEHPAAQPAVPLTEPQRKAIYDAVQGLDVMKAILMTEAAHGITKKGQP